jgi:hypothetical protein
MSLILKKLIKDILSKISLLLFPQAERVGDPSEQKDSRHRRVAPALRRGCRGQEETGQAGMTKLESGWAKNSEAS